MKQVVNKHIPFGKFKAMAVWPFIFIRSDKLFRETDIIHEEIHGRQQKEMLLIFFYITYFICWFKELIHCGINKDRGQIVDKRYKPRKFISRVEHSIIFEREAYEMQFDDLYLARRKFWAWVKF